MLKVKKNTDIIFYKLTSLDFLQQGIVKKSKNSMKIYENLLILTQNFFISSE